MSDKQESWLPNLVGGVSIWRLAGDLNDPKYFDGRLLEPETEGSDSLPASVSWDLAGLVPLPEARDAHGQAVEAAIADFFACLERVSDVMGDEDSGYHKFQEAFTVPSLDADGGAHYFFDPKSGKLHVVNWGASPRSIDSSQSYLFGFGSFDELYEREGVAPAGEGGAASSDDEDAGEQAAAAGAAGGDEAEDEKEDDEEEEEAQDGDRPLWVWFLMALAAIAVIVASLLMLKECADNPPLHDAADAGADGGADAAPSPSASASGNTDAGAAPQGQGGADAGAKGKGGGGAGPKGQGGADAGAAGQGGADAGPKGDGGADGKDGDGKDGDGKDGDGKAGGKAAFEVECKGGGKGGGKGGKAGGKVVIVGKGGSSGSGGGGQVHAKYARPGAQRWRITRGAELVDRVELDGSDYHVYLRSGGSFERITVQYQDAAGKWHDN